MMTRKPKSYFFYLSYILNCGIVIFVFFPILFSAPRSDYWAAYYNFSHLNGLLNLNTLKQLSNYELFGHQRFQPLSSIILYIITDFFQSRILLYNLFNLFLYLVLIFILYKVSLFLTGNSLIRLLVIGSLSVLLTHFDIVGWSYHCYIIIGAILFFTALYLLLGYPELHRTFFLLFFSLCLLLGLLCYEPFFIWPILFLFMVKDMTPSKNLKLDIIFCNLIVYSIYFLIFSWVFFLPRLNPAFYSFRFRELFSPANINVASNFVFQNFLFISILSNVFPFLVAPLNMTKNVELQGLLFKNSYLHSYLQPAYSIPILSVSLFILFIIIFLFIIKSLRERQKIFFIFVIFLMYFSYYFALSLGRALTNPRDYIFFQPRYQLIPNILVAMLLLYFIDGIYRKSSKVVKLLLVLFFIYVFSINIFYTQRSVKRVALELKPLTTMLTNIHRALEENIITEDSPLYIPKDIVNHMPGLCWNHDMDRFIKEGSYEYIFKDKLHLFKFSQYEAKYTIDRKRFEIIPIGN